MVLELAKGPQRIDVEVQDCEEEATKENLTNDKGGCTVSEKYSSPYARNQDFLEEDNERAIQDNSGCDKRVENGHREF